ncbi:MAG: DUF116 domain-containing protein [Thermodesulfobacteriota bacterium]
MPDSEEKLRANPESIDYSPGRGLFVALLAISALAVAGAGFFFWYIPTVGLRSIHPALPIALGVVVAAVSALVLGGAVVLAAAMTREKIPFYSKTLHWLLIKLYLPLMVMAGGLLRVPKIKIEQLFIDLNNKMVRAMGRRFKPERLLILMPHCIQWDDCKLKVTRKVRNCAGCGKCEIGDLIKMMDEFGIEIFISTGGTVARRKVVELRPQAVVAVACERDLTSGLQDAYPLPVLAIINKRPQGYCMGTGVDLDEVRSAIKDLVA